MLYFDDMFNNKYGFDDGNAIPPDARAFREIIIRAVNRLAEQLESSQRLVAYDRPGWHNSCLILLHFKRDLDNAGIAPGQFHLHTDILNDTLSLSTADPQMELALEEAEELELDQYLEVQVAIHTNFDKFLLTLLPNNNANTEGSST